MSEHVHMVQMTDMFWGDEQTGTPWEAKTPFASWRNITWAC